MEDKPLDAAFGISPSPDSETDPEIQAVLDELVAAYGGLSDGEPLEMRTMRVDTPLEVADGPAPVAAGPQHGPRNRDESR